MRKEGLSWSVDEDGRVTLALQNKGLFHFLAQKLLKKPKVSYIHLDEMGSFLWQRLDGKKSLIALGEEVETVFGDAASPLYERLAKYIQILESYGFIKTLS